MCLNIKKIAEDEVFKESILTKRFLVSNYGRLYDCQSSSIKEDKSIYADKNEYRSVHLADLGVGNNVPVHRVVALAFIENPLGYSIINHLDGNKRNNCAANLEWTTPSENTKHAWRIGLISRENPPAKYTEKLDVTVSPEIKQNIEKEAERTGRTTSGMIRYILTDYFKGYKKT